MAAQFDSEHPSDDGGLSEKTDDELLELLEQAATEPQADGKESLTDYVERLGQEESIAEGSESN
jgi:hypothetical protein